MEQTTFIASKCEIQSGKNLLSQSVALHKLRVTTQKETKKNLYC